MGPNLDLFGNNKELEISIGDAAGVRQFDEVNVDSGAVDERHEPSVAFRHVARGNYGMNGGHGGGMGGSREAEIPSTDPDPKHIISSGWKRGMVRWGTRHTAAEGDKSPQPRWIAATQGSIREWVSESPWYCSVAVSVCLPLLDEGTPLNVKAGESPNGSSVE